MNKHFEQITQFALFIFIAISIYSSINPVRLADFITDSIDTSLTRLTMVSPMSETIRNY